MIDYYIPDFKINPKTLINEVEEIDIPAIYSNKDDYVIFLESILDLKFIHIENKLNEFEMLFFLVEKMFDTQDILAADIDLIILAIENKPYNINIAKQLQHKLQMKNAFIIEVTGNHCANVDVAQNMANLYLNSYKNINNVLILTSSKTELAKDRIIGSYAILSDGAGIMLVNSQSSIKLIDSVVLSNGSLHCVDLNADNSFNHMKYYKKSLKRLIENNEIQVNDIISIIVQNANPTLVTYIVKSFGFDPDIIFTENFGRFGHLEGVDQLINIKSIIEKPDIVNRGRQFITLSMGWAGSYASSLFTIR